MTAQLNASLTAEKIYRVLIIGAGFSGIGMAVRLKQRGEDDFVVYEKEAGVGGTWWVNQYPGCACDIPSHLYSFSFEPNPDWSRRFSPQPEIRDYLARCADKYQLLPHIQFKREVASLRWLEKRALWQVTDGSGQVVFARVVVAGTGALSTPDYPNIAGLQRFRGRVFHSQHWDHDHDLKGNFDPPLIDKSQWFLAASRTTGQPSLAILTEVGDPLLYCAQAHLKLSSFRLVSRSQRHLRVIRRPWFTRCSQFAGQ